MENTKWKTESRSRFGLASWVTDEIRTFCDELAEISWTNVIIGAVALLLTGAFMALPWLSR